MPRHTRTDDRTRSARARISCRGGALLVAVTAIATSALLAGGTGVVGAATSRRKAHASSRSPRRTVAAHAPQTDAPAGVLPDPPYAVGVLHLTVTDPSRPAPDRDGSTSGGPRTIGVTLRYPTMGPASDPEAAGVIADVGSYPLVVFSPGFDVSADTYARLEHQMAAAGFVVAAPDFPGTSSALSGAPDEDDVANQATDVSFVISSLLDPVTVPDQLAGTISSAKVGVVGHSDGGVTTAAVAFNSSVADPRIGAAVVLSGAEARYPGSWFAAASSPMLLVHATADEVNPFASSQTLYDDDATGPKMLVSVLGGSHLGPFTTDPEEPQVATLVTDYLRAELDHDGAAQSRIVADANAPGALSLVASA